MAAGERVLIEAEVHLVVCPALAGPRRQRRHLARRHRGAGRIGGERRKPRDGQPYEPTSALARSPARPHAVRLPLRVCDVFFTASSVRQLSSVDPLNARHGVFAVRSCSRLYYKLHELRRRHFVFSTLSYVSVVRAVYRQLFAFETSLFIHSIRLRTQYCVVLPP